MQILRKHIWLVLPSLLFLGCTSMHDKGECIFSETKTAVFWDEQKLDEAFQLACGLGTTTLMVVTNGEVVKTMGELDEPLRVHSVRKALLSALVGQHVGKGHNQINLDSTLAELNINDKPNPLTPLQQQAKVLHLIKSVSGINHEAAAEDGLLKKEKDKRLGHKANPPGTVWAYNNWDYNALTTIFEQETGMTVFEAFKTGIAEPIGMQDFTKNSVFYNYEKRLSKHPKAGFKMSARDLAKFGQLYLDKGKWNAKKIIPAAWIERITEDYTVTGDEGPRSAHGYLWWVPVDRQSREFGIPEGSFWAAGFCMQIVWVIPAWDSVIVHQFDTRPLIACVIKLIEEGGYSFKEAIMYIHDCNNPERSTGGFCKRCGWTGNFLESTNVEKIFSKIIEARITE
jgi:CubicO group peptidase (beta-lactamase class C family)